MCEALKEIMRDELRESEEMGERNINGLNSYLIENGRIEEMIQSVRDKNLQKKLMKEYQEQKGLQNA